MWRFTGSNGVTEGLHAKGACSGKHTSSGIATTPECG